MIVIFFININFIVQLFVKLECDELEILEHTKELLEELGPAREDAMTSQEMEGTREKDKDEESEDGDEEDSEQLEEETAETDNSMELS